MTNEEKLNILLEIMEKNHKKNPCHNYYFYKKSIRKYIKQMTLRAQTPVLTLGFSKWFIEEVYQHNDLEMLKALEKIEILAPEHCVSHYISNETKLPLEVKIKINNTFKNEL